MLVLLARVCIPPLPGSLWQPTLALPLVGGSVAKRIEDLRADGVPRGLTLKMQARACMPPNH